MDSIRYRDEQGCSAKYEAEMEVYSPQEMEEAKRNDDICKKLGAALVRKYQNRQFYVEVVDNGRVAVVKMPAISMEYGLVLHLSGVIEADERKVVHAAGEVLERFGLTRGRTDNTDISKLERNSRGSIHAKVGEVA
jgi:hypothetical protein